MDSAGSMLPTLPRLDVTRAFVGSITEGTVRRVEIPRDDGTAKVGAIMLSVQDNPPMKAIVPPSVLEHTAGMLSEA